MATLLDSVESCGSFQRMGHESLCFSEELGVKETHMRRGTIRHGAMRHSAYISNMMIEWHNPKLKELARDLRNNSTLSEVLLWGALKGIQMRGYDFHR